MAEPWLVGAVNCSPSIPTTKPWLTTATLGVSATANGPYLANPLGQAIRFHVRKGFCVAMACFRGATNGRYGSTILNPLLPQRKAGLLLDKGSNDGPVDVPSDFWFLIFNFVSKVS